MASRGRGHLGPAHEISLESQDLISKYRLYLLNDCGVARNSAKSNLNIIYSWSRFLDVATMTTDDILRAKIALEDTGLKQNTRRVYISKFFRFSRWCYENGNKNIDVDRLMKIKIPRRDWNTRTAEGMLTPDEVNIIIQTSRSPRDRAIFTLLYEGGFRPVEVVRLTWGQVKFDEYGVIINVSDKTGIARYIRLIASKELLARWKDATPGPTGPTDPVFVKIHKPYDAIHYNLVWTILRDLVKQAKIDKPVSPYLFRHSRITHMIEQEIPESVVKMQHWGNMRTGMLATYTHLTGNHIDEVLLDRAGIRRSEKRRDKNAMSPSQCPRCNYINPPTSQFCSTCGMSLTEDQRSKEETIRRIMSDTDLLVEYALWRKGREGTE